MIRLVKHLNTLIYFGNEHGDPKFLFHFPTKQLMVYTWLEYNEIGIIIGISSEVNTKLFIQIFNGGNI